MGPATEALERSTKRRRLSQTGSESSNCASFQLDAMFNDISSIDDEAFPSIGWNFDDDDDEADATPSVSAQTSFELSSFKTLSGSKRQSPAGMVRSKAFSCGLDTMSPSHTSSEPLQLDSISEALPSYLKSSKLDHNMYILSSSLPPRRKHVVGPSYFATQRMRA
jgi:hypothetical protein